MPHRSIIKWSSTDLDVSPSSRMSSLNAPDRVNAGGTHADSWYSRRREHERHDHFRNGNAVRYQPSCKKSSHIPRCRLRWSELSLNHESTLVPRNYLRYAHQLRIKAKSAHLTLIQSLPSLVLPPTLLPIGYTTKMAENHHHTC